LGNQRLEIQRHIRYSLCKSFHYSTHCKYCPISPLKAYYSQSRNLNQSLIEIKVGYRIEHPDD
jgi:hypothetical protein